MDAQHMIKVIGCTIIVGASSFIGFVFAEELNNRARQLRQFQSAFLQLQNEIIFTHRTLPEVFNKISNKCEGPVGRLFSDIGEKLSKNEVDTVYEAFKKSLEEKKNDLVIDSLDVDVVLDVGKELGEGDIEGHKKLFILAEENMKKRIEDADCRIKKSAKVYRYLGFSFGMVVAILLI